MVSCLGSVDVALGFVVSALGFAVFALGFVVSLPSRPHFEPPPGDKKGYLVAFVPKMTKMGLILLVFTRVLGARFF